MFKNLTIKNFKSHKDTRIDFSPGINVLSGIGQAGKTAALIGAVELLSKNRPSSGGYLSDFAGLKGTTNISLGLTEGIKVSLSKRISVDKNGEKKVRSTVYHMSGGGKEGDWSGVGKNVPDEVESVLNLSHLSFQKQLDSPFLVTSSPGEIARVINRVTKLDKSDLWVAEITKRINRANSDVDLFEDQRKEANKELERYSNISEVETVVRDLKSTYDRLRDIRRKVLFLDKDLILVENFIEGINKLKKFLDAEKYILKAEVLLRKLHLIASKKELVRQFISLTVYIKKKSSLLVVLTELDSIVELRKEKMKFEYLIHRVESFTKVIDGLNTKYKEARNEYIAQLKEFGKCPLCLSDINAECIKRIREEFM